MTDRSRFTTRLFITFLALAACTSDGGTITEGAADTTTQETVTQTTSVATPPTEPPVETTLPPTTTTSSVAGEPLIWNRRWHQARHHWRRDRRQPQFPNAALGRCRNCASVLTTDESHDIVSRGDLWLTPTSVWWHLTIDGDEAWANQKYLAAFGLTDDITSQVVASGVEKSAETIEALGLAVAASRASTDPVSTIVVVDESSGNRLSLAEITVDVIGLGDDAQKGERLHIFANVVYEEATETIMLFELKSVEATLLCSRGISDGLCL
ncbi:MAG: hypothetical protein R2706_07010 [Acidimicrobiales bacterium]